MKRYAEILKKYENQRDDDYDDMLFDAWMRNQSLENATGEVKISGKKAGAVLVRIWLRLGFFLILFTFPVVATTIGHISDSKQSSPLRRHQ